MLGKLGVQRPETLVPAKLGVDAAVVAADDDQWAWVLTCDPITTAVSGADRLGVYVVCNDLAAMGAMPAWVLMALTLPEPDEAWLEGFSRGFFALADKHEMALVGGVKPPQAAQ